jgi:hypothetical protein
MSAVLLADIEVDSTFRVDPAVGVYVTAARVPDQLSVKCSLCTQHSLSTFVQVAKPATKATSATKAHGLHVCFTHHFAKDWFIE